MHNIGYLSKPEKCDRRAILWDIKDIAEQDGDGYSGPLKWHDEVKPLESREAAEEWIKAHDKGWYDDHAVRYYDYSQVKDTKKVLELRQRCRDVYDKQIAYEKAHSVKTFKANLITCPKCGSKLSVYHLRSEKCPLCYTDLRSKTTLETIANYEKRRADIGKQIEDEKRKGKGEVRWLIKYEYHS